MFPILKNRIVGAVFAILLMATAITSCCRANYKCKGDSLELRFRLISSTGNDLLFGPGRIYDSRQIRLYSLRGTDTIFHHCLTGPNPEPGKDSIVYADMEPFEVLYVKWNNADTDSIFLQLKEVDASPCCPDFKVIETLRLNISDPLKDGNWGVFELRK